MTGRPPAPDQATLTVDGVVPVTTLVLTPTALAMRDIGPWLHESTRELEPRATPTLVSRMELAVHETCMNVVDHAELADGDRIELALLVGPTAVGVRVRDPGTAFDPGTAEEPAAGQLQERGYGVKIVRSLVDQLDYRRVDGRNELLLRFDLGGSP